MAGTVVELRRVSLLFYFNQSYAQVKEVHHCLLLGVQGRTTRELTSVCIDIVKQSICRGFELARVLRGFPMS